MTKESKFRAWDKRNKCWSIGPLYIDEDGVLFEIYEGSFDFQTYMHKENVGEDHDVCWYTGLKDKNGVDIYDGDVVSDGRYSYEIRWSKEAPAFEAVLIGSSLFNWLSDDMSECEIIGNRYENPNLLEAK